MPMPVLTQPVESESCRALEGPPDELKPHFVYTSITRCRICDHGDLAPLLDLGAQSPANSLRESVDEPLPVVPLRISMCRRCATVQLLETVSPEYLFRNYTWVTGTSRAARQHSVYFYEQTAARCGRRQMRVVEVASNDGTFLRRFQEGGHRVLGVDPATNVARIANDAGLETWSEFFDAETARKILAAQGTADCVFARNVVPHVADIHGVIGGMAALLDSEGIGAVEFHYGLKILEELHYDSIYHEHLFYYSLGSIGRLLEMHGLHPYDILDSPISGGSKILYFSKSRRSRTPLLERDLECEARHGLNRLESWLAFAGRSRAHGETLLAEVRRIHGEGKRIIGYGASARSSTLLNFCGVDSRYLACIADAAPLKQGKLTPGTNLRIVAPEQAFDPRPDAVLLLAWNLRKEIVAEIRQRHGFRGIILLPLPCRIKVLEC